MKTALVIGLIAASVSFTASARTMITHDGQMNFSVSSGLMYMHEKSLADTVICKEISTASSAKEWEGKFYKCPDNVTVSIKHYADHSKDDVVFIFNGNDIVYVGEVLGRFY